MSRSTVMRIGKNTGALFIARTSVMAFSLFFVIYVARLLGVTGFGKYSLIRGYFDLFLGLSATGLGIVVTREVAKSPKRLNEYLSVSLLLILLLTVAACVLLISLIYILPYSEDTRAACLVCAVALFPSTVATVFESIFIAYEKAEYVTYGTLAESIIRTGLSLLALFLGFNLLAIFTILLFTRILMLLIYVGFTRRYIAKPSLIFDKNAFQGLLHKWKIFALENWLSSLFLNLDIIVLSFFHGEVAVGIYSAASRVPNLLSVISVSYTAAVFPHMSRLFQESKSAFERLSDLSVRFMLMVILPCAVVISILADQIVLLLFSEQFSRSVPILRVLIWVLVVRFLSPFLSHLLFARGQQNLSLRVVVVSLSCYIVLLAWLTPWAAEIGTAWAVLLSGFIALSLYFWFLLRERESASVLAMLSKMALAAIAMSITLFLLPNYTLLVKLGITAGIYVGLLFGLGLLRYREIAQLFLLFGEKSHYFDDTTTQT